MAFAAKLEQAEKILGRTFVDQSLLQAALLAAGAGTTLLGTHDISEGNKRLALLGDSVLKAALLSSWYPTKEPRGMSL